MPLSACSASREQPRFDPRAGRLTQLLHGSEKRVGPHSQRVRKPIILSSLLLTLRIALTWLILCGGIAPLGGCLVPASRVRSCQARYHQLSERNKALQTELANLTAHSRKLEGERNQTEQELLSLDRQGRYLAESLSSPGSGRKLPAAVSAQLEKLAEDYQGMQYDPARGMVRIDPEALFARGNPKLAPAAGEMLSDLGSLLRLPEVQSRRVLIVAPQHSTATAEAEGPHARLNVDRAVAVRDFLKAWGIPGDRLGVSSYGPAQIAATGDATSPRETERPLEVFLLSSQVPVLGWDEKSPAVYR